MSDRNQNQCTTEVPPQKDIDHLCALWRSGRAEFHGNNSQSADQFKTSFEDYLVQVAYELGVGPEFRSWIEYQGGRS